MNLKKIAILLAVLIVGTIYLFINPSKVDFLPKCPFYLLTGLYCPGCGSQRATHQLLHLNFLGVLNQNVLYVLGLLLFLYHVTIQVVNKFLNKNIYNYIYHSKTPIIILIFIILFWILRNIPSYPFNLLAPN